jgi:hypothetical protein
MDLPISKEYFDNDVIFSLLIDAANVIFRTKLPTIERDDRWLSWRNDLIKAFLPRASASLPLSAVQITPTDSEPNCVCFVDIPVEKLERIAAEFLTELLRDVDAQGIAKLDDAQKVGLDEAIVGVARRVASGWSRAWL